MDESLPTLLCEYVEQCKNTDLESLCEFLERLAMILRSYHTVVEYASAARVGNDLEEDWKATQRAMRMAIKLAFQKRR